MNFVKMAVIAMRWEIEEHALKWWMISVGIYLNAETLFSSLR